MNYCPNCGYRFPGGYHPPVQPYTPYTPYPTYPYWFTNTIPAQGDSNGTQRSS